MSTEDGETIASLLTLGGGLSYSEQPFTLRAGGESHWYFDAKRAMAPSHVIGPVGRLAVVRVRELGIDYSHICSMGIGGHALMFAMVLADPENTEWTMAYEGKPDDPDNGLSGAEVKGKKVLLVDDVLSTGDSLVTTIDMIREEGGDVTDALVLVTRSSGAAEQRMIDERNVNVSALFRFSESEGRILTAA